mmetsp:Transcript_22809/g.29553  ORF Transcript_22809/g.29553 Transcript_22809/m.29553 type:complete len:167 (+) Transcript_22809:55-555(+)
MQSTARVLGVRLARKVASKSRFLSTVAEADGKKMLFSLTAPHASICFQEPVDLVQLPGANGEYGVTVGHSPLAEQLNSGIVTIVRTGEAPEKYFISGGFALTDEKKTEVSVAEALKLDDMDDEKIKVEYAKAKSMADSATDEKVKADATLAADTARAIAIAKGVAL